MTHPHFSTGQPCDCTFTAHLQYPSSIHTAGKLHDFLMNPQHRPDLQTPEGQRWLNLLQARHNDIGEHFDPLTPWLTREWKKGRIRHEWDDALDVSQDRTGEGPGYVGRMYWNGPQGDIHNLNNTSLSHWADYLRSTHPHRRDLGDIMQHQVGPFAQRVKDWDKAMEEEANTKALEGGYVYHTTPDNWTIRRLTTPEELKAEGNAMGHCVGGYAPSVERGNTQIYSLRDPKNSPHTTIEIRPSDITKGTGPHQGQVVQIQGKSNREPQDEYKERIKNWFQTFPPDQRPSWGDRDDDDDHGLHDDDGYWHSTLDHPDLIPKHEREYGTLEKKAQPFEDAYGLIRQPNAMDADYDDLLDNIKFHDYGSQGSAPDKDHIKDIVRLAEARKEIPQLYGSLEGYQQKQDDDFQNWMDNNYEYSPQYPDEPTGWEGPEDEYGDPQHYDEEREGARPYWQIMPNKDDPYNDKYYDPAEAERAYDQEYESWEGQHAGMQAVNQLYRLLEPYPHPDETPPPAPPTTSKTAARRGPPSTHKNPWGDPCSCPWSSKKDLEHVGAIHEASKLDWLRERPDVQKDPYKRFIVNRIFPRYHETVDSLLPWLLREYNNKRLILHPTLQSVVDHMMDAEQKYNDFIKAGFDPDSSTGEQLRSDLGNHEGLVDGYINRGFGLLPEGNRTADVRHNVERFADMMDTLKKRGQGIDLMQHDYPTMMQKTSDHEEEEERRKEEERRRDNGQIVHKFDNPKGWTVRRLAKRDECDLEGELMGHCVGSYGHAAENGDTNIYSLRDEKNNPHATMEIKPIGGNPKDPKEWRIPEHAWDELPMKNFRGVPIEDIRDYHDQYGDVTSGHPADQVYPEFMAKAKEHGTAMPPVEGEIIQTQGKSNSTPIPEYTQMLDKFLEPHNLQSFKPWWDDYYEMDGPQHFHDLLGYHGDESLFGMHDNYWNEGEPDEYQRAVYEAEENGLEEPELRTGMPNYEGILQSIIEPPRYVGYANPWQGYNPKAGQYVLDRARENDRWERENPDRVEHAHWNHRHNGWGNHEREIGDAIKDLDIPHYEPFNPSLEQLTTLDPWALQKVENEHYDQQGITDHPMVQMYNHLGSQVLPDFQPIGSYQTQTQIHPEQMNLFKFPTLQLFDGPYRYPKYDDPNYSYPWANHPSTGEYNPAVPNDLRYTKVAHPIYKRWVFSPASGEVKLADNTGHPLDVKYHSDLARELNEPNLSHGFAYRIGDGWRITDWNSKPIDDQYVVASVMRALTTQRGKDQSDWNPDYDEDWERVHLGLPS